MLNGWWPIVLYFCLDRPGFRPGGRLTFLSRDKKVSKETRPPCRPFGVPSLRTLSAAGPAEPPSADIPGRPTPPPTLFPRRLPRGGDTRTRGRVAPGCVRRPGDGRGGKT